MSPEMERWSYKLWDYNKYFWTKFLMFLCSKTLYIIQLVIFLSEINESHDFELKTLRYIYI